MMENLTHSGWEVYSVENSPTFGELKAINANLVTMHSKFYGADPAELRSFPVCLAPGPPAKFDQPGIRTFAAMMEQAYPAFRDTLPSLIYPAGGEDSHTTKWGPEWNEYLRVSELLAVDGKAAKVVKDVIDFFDANRPLTCVSAH